jgi:hypothetical protein
MGLHVPRRSSPDLSGGPYRASRATQPERGLARAARLRDPFVEWRRRARGAAQSRRYTKKTPRTSPGRFRRPKPCTLEAIVARPRNGCAVLRRPPQRTGLTIAQSSSRRQQQTSPGCSPRRRAPRRRPVAPSQRLPTRPVRPRSAPLLPRHARHAPHALRRIARSRLREAPSRRRPFAPPTAEPSGARPRSRPAS